MHFPFSTRKDLELRGTLPFCCRWHPLTTLQVPVHLLFLLLLDPIRSQLHNLPLGCRSLPWSRPRNSTRLQRSSRQLGALAATVLYNYIGSRTKFWVVSWFGLIGFLLTVVFIPDTTGLDLGEQERYWQYVRHGRAHDYHGVAVHRRHLSWYEIVVLKRHQAYDPELDKQANVKDMRDLYGKISAQSENEAEKGDADARTLLGESGSAYFEWEKTNGQKMD